MKTAEVKTLINEMQKLWDNPYSKMCFEDADGTPRYSAKAVVTLVKKTFKSYANGYVKEILLELISIREYMKEKDAFHGYGQMNDLITKLEEIK